jgi:hypothetical protein
MKKYSILLLCAALLWGGVSCGDKEEDSPEIAVKIVSVSPTSVSVAEGESETVTATVLPENATNKAVSWASADVAVATVANGVITGVAAGTTTVTVTTADGGRTAEVAVTVFSTAPALTLNTPANGEAIALDKATPEAELAFAWTTANVPSGAAFELVVSQNSDLSNPLQSVSLTADNKAFTHQELQDLLFTGATLTAGIKRYKPNTLYWNVKVNGEYLSPAGSFTLRGMTVFKDVRGPETILYDVAILNYGGQEHAWFAENFYAKRYPNGDQMTYRTITAGHIQGINYTPGRDNNDVVGGEVQSTPATAANNSFWGTEEWLSANSAVAAKILAAHPMLYDIWCVDGGTGIDIVGNTISIEALTPAGWKMPDNVDLRDLMNAAGAAEGGIGVLYHPDAFTNNFAEQIAAQAGFVAFSSKAHFNDWKMNFTPSCITIGGGMTNSRVRFAELILMCRIPGDDFYSRYIHRIDRQNADYDVIQCQRKGQTGTGTNAAATNNESRGVAIRFKYTGE